MKASNYISIPSRMNELWPWVVALDAWDYCDSEPLSELVFNEKIIPVEFLRPISEIISGKRLPKRKAAVKLKIPARERMKIAASISLVLGLIDVFKTDVITDYGEGVVGLADEKGKEPISILKELENEHSEIIKSTCQELSVSQETIENLLRQLRGKIDNWPNI